MIFVTVGTQEPFDRLIAAVDRWAAAHPERSVFAQTGPGGRPPRHVPAREFLPPAECLRRVRAAELVIAHAGMGTILSALEAGTPVLVMPRQADLGEHRNDHQMATARWLASSGSVGVAFDEVELASRLDDSERCVRIPPISATAPEPLITALTDFITGDVRPVRGT